jgi:hypothetical protein
MNNKSIQRYEMDQWAVSFEGHRKRRKSWIGFPDAGREQGFVLSI